MKLAKILRGEYGFSLMEITVAIGLLALATLAVVNLSESVNTQSRRAEMLLSKSQFASALGNYAHSALACNEFKTMGPFGVTAKAVVFNNWKVAGIEEPKVFIVQSGRRFKNFNLSSLTANMDVVSTNLARIRIGGVDGVKTFLNLTAVIRVKQNQKGANTDPSSFRDYNYSFNIPVLATLAGVVMACSEEKTLQEACESLNGVLNASTGKCDLSNSCLLQGAFQLLTCSPGPPGQTCDPSGGNTTSNPTTGSPSCPSGSTQVQTGYKTWSHIGTCGGKKCTPPTVTDVLTYYSCMKCP